MTEPKAPPLQTVHYRILNPLRKNPVHAIEVPTSATDLEALVDDGYFVAHDWFSVTELGEMAAAVDRIAAREAGRPDDRVQAYGGWQYLRGLLDKDSTFLRLVRFEPALRVAQYVLGPQVRFDEAVAKYGHAGVAGQFVPWHIHMRAVTHPLPPFFCYPHAIHIFLNLDPVDEQNGQFCVLPGSHRFTCRIYRQDDRSDLPGQRVFSLPAGSCVVMHANLWHRTLPSKITGGLRRVIVYGYLPAWMTGEERGGVTSGDTEPPAPHPLLERFRW